ncbi:oxygenase MpaB family protein [Cellulomonas sp. ATA003]|uniref:oxygenase MpaB family protein n=1 Tax=Cellulomonas sp. ATA003 TaxID=3073064 RepID=UPI00287394ED|nr:oxygenase MpaB family protein [Cellulomonas sp. ATA003]WNB87167.1 oxygenase MpaB family protein [Cellulomonas sp. ATA003]
MTVTDEVRTRIGDALFARVAGPEGPEARDRIHGTPGPRWFPEGSAIQRVHGDASMFIGGLRALLLQSLHPQAMAAVAAHSGYRGDPWGRLARTSTFLATTTFGTADDAAQAVAVVRAVHERISGVTSDGLPYAASDPHLVRWVHVAEAHSFLAAHQRYGAEPLDAAGCDEYVAQVAVVGRALGAIDPPTTLAELVDQLRAYSPELRATTEAHQAARFLLVSPPLPWAARPPYVALAAAAVAMMPRWTRRPLRLPYLPVAEDTVVRAAGHAITRTIRWALGAAERRVESGEPVGVGARPVGGVPSGEVTRGGPNAHG